MKLISLKLKNFKKFKNQEVKFSDGVNVIYGKNEHGKTTILRALQASLFADSKTKSVDFLEKIQSWGSELLPRLELLFQDNEDRYILVRDFEEKIQFLENLTDGTKYISPAKITEKIHNLIGIGNAATFNLTALVEQNEIASVGSMDEKSVASLQEKIQESLTGRGNVSVFEVIKNIDKALLDLEKGLNRPAKINGQIQELILEKSALETKLKEISGELSQIVDSTDTREDSAKELKELQKKIKDLESLIDNNRKREDAEKKLKDLTAKSKDLQSSINDVENAERKKREREVELESYPAIEKINEASDKLKDLELRLKSLEEQRFDTESDIEKFSNDVEKERAKLRITTLVSTVVVLISATVIGAVLGYMVYGLFAGVILGGLVLTVLPRVMKSDKFAKIDMLKESLNEFAKNIADLNKEEVDLLKSIEVKDSREMYTLRAKVNSLKDEINQYKITSNTLLKNRTLKELHEDLSGILLEKKDIEENVLTEEVKSAIIEQRDRFGKMRELDDLKRKQNKLETENVRSELLIEGQRYTVDDKVRVEEKLAQVEKDLHFYEEKSKVLHLVKDFIIESKESVSKSSGALISEYIGKFLPLITGGRYSKIRVGSTLNFEIFSEEKKDWVSPDKSLSSGTIDQVYFLSRLALLDLITKGKNTPVILDDPFVTFDEDRQQFTKQIIDELSAERQFILLTCHDIYADWGKVIDIKQ